MHGREQLAQQLPPLLARTRGLHLCQPGQPGQQAGGSRAGAAGSGPTPTPVAGQGTGAAAGTGGMELLHYGEVTGMLVEPMGRGLGPGLCKGLGQGQGQGRQGK